MKRDLLDILACPLCKGEFTLEVEEENETEVVKGWLVHAGCDGRSGCTGRYPIEDTIPNLLPPDMR